MEIEGRPKRAIKVPAKFKEEEVTAVKKRPAWMMINQEPEEEVPLYCVCRKPYKDGDFMIHCDKCKEWFHGKCVHVSQKEAAKINKYVCPACSGQEEAAEVLIEPVQIPKKHRSQESAKPAKGGPKAPAFAPPLEAAETSAAAKVPESSSEGGAPNVGGGANKSGKDSATGGGANAKAKEGGEASGKVTQRPKKENLVCSVCKNKGHIRTHRECPMYGQQPKSPAAGGKQTASESKEGEQSEEDAPILARKKAAKKAPTTAILPESAPPLMEVDASFPHEEEEHTMLHSGTASASFDTGATLLSSPLVTKQPATLLTPSLVSQQPESAMPPPPQPANSTPPLVSEQPQSDIGATLLPSPLVSTQPEKEAIILPPPLVGKQPELDISAAPLRPPLVSQQAEVPPSNPAVPTPIAVSPKAKKRELEVTQGGGPSKKPRPPDLGGLPAALGGPLAQDPSPTFERTTSKGGSKQVVPSSPRNPPAQAGRGHDPPAPIERTTSKGGGKPVVPSSPRTPPGKAVDASRKSQGVGHHSKDTSNPRTKEEQQADEKVRQISRKGLASALALMAKEIGGGNESAKEGGAKREADSISEPGKDSKAAETKGDAAEPLVEKEEGEAKVEASTGEGEHEQGKAADGGSAKQEEGAGPAKSQEELLQLAELVAGEIEAAMYAEFGGAGNPYRQQSRMVTFNLRDPKNAELRRRVLAREIGAQELATATADQLANKELSQWRHAKEEELDALKVLKEDPLEALRRVRKKTHKGEQDVEADKERLPPGAPETEATRQDGGADAEQPSESNEREDSGGAQEASKQPLTVSTGETSTVTTTSERAEASKLERAPKKFGKEGLYGLAAVKEESKEPTVARGNHATSEEDTLGKAKKEEGLSLEEYLEACMTGGGEEDSESSERGGEDLAASDEENEAEKGGEETFSMDDLLWEGHLIVSAKDCPVIVSFQGGERLSIENWPMIVEVKGRVKVSDLRKFLETPQLNRHRSLMLSGLTFLDDSAEVSKKGTYLAQAAQSYIDSKRVGFAEPIDGTELYLIPPQTIPELGSLLPPRMQQGGSSEEMLGLVVQRRIQADVTPPARSPLGQPEAWQQRGGLAAGEKLPPETRQNEQSAQESSASEVAKAGGDTGREREEVSSQARKHRDPRLRIFQATPPRQESVSDSDGPPGFPPVSPPPSSTSYSPLPPPPPLSKSAPPPQDIRPPNLPSSLGPPQSRPPPAAVPVLPPPLPPGLPPPSHSAPPWSIVHSQPAPLGGSRQVPLPQMRPPPPQPHTAPPLPPVLPPSQIPGVPSTQHFNSRRGVGPPLPPGPPPPHMHHGPPRPPGRPPHLQGPFSTPPFVQSFEMSPTSVSQAARGAPEASEEWGMQQWLKQEEGARKR